MSHGRLQGVTPRHPSGRRHARRTPRPPADSILTVTGEQRSAWPIRGQTYHTTPRAEHHASKLMKPPSAAAFSMDWLQVLRGLSRCNLLARRTRKGGSRIRPGSSRCATTRQKRKTPSLQTPDAHTAGRSLITWRMASGCALASPQQTLNGGPRSSKSAGRQSPPFGTASASTTFSPPSFPRLHQSRRRAG